MANWDEALEKVKSGGEASAEAAPVKKPVDWDSALSNAKMSAPQTKVEVKRGPADYYSHAAREAFATAAGAYPDFPARLMGLTAAQQGYTGGANISPFPALQAIANLTGFVNRKPDDPLPTVGGTNAVTDWLKRLLVADVPMKPQNPTEQYLGGVLQGAVGGLAGGPAKTGGGMLLDLGKQILYGTLAGTGAETAGAITGQNDAARIAGGILASTVLPSTFQKINDMRRMSSGVGSDAAERIRQEGAPLVEKMVNKQLRESVAGTEGAAENITEALALQKKIPGLRYSVAEMAGSEGVSDMQRRYALLSPKNLNAERARDAANKRAIVDYYDSIAPERGAASSARSAVNRSLAVDDAALAERARGVSRQAPEADQFTIGSKLSEIADAEKLKARPAIQAAYNKAFEASNAKVASDEIIGTIEDVLGEPLNRVKPENSPNVVSTIKRIFGGVKPNEGVGRSVPPDLMEAAGVAGPKQITLKDLHDIRVALGQDIESANRSLDPTAATRLRNLSRVYEKVDDAISRLPESQRTLYESATEKFRTEYAPRFKEGANRRVFQGTSLNEPRILPEKFVSEFFSPDASGGVTRAQQFSRLFKGNADAQRLARDGILGLYRRDVMDPTTGALSLEKHNAFMQKHAGSIKSFDDAGVTLSGTLDKIGKDIVSVQDAMRRFDSVANVLRYDTVEKMTDAALANPKVMGNVLMRLDNKSRDVFRRSLMDKAWEGESAKAMSSFLEKHKKTLGMVLLPEHMNALKDVSRALEIAERAPVRGILQAGGPDMLKNTTGVSTATVWAQYRATTAGRQGFPTAVFNLSAPVMSRLSQTQFTDVMEKALHDPQTAVALRDFLLAPDTVRTTSGAAKLLERMKEAGQIVYNMRGPILRMGFGVPYLKENFGRGVRPATDVGIQEE